MSADVVRVDAIRVEDRARVEYRNIDSLAGSIQTLGLLHPPVVTPDLRLIAGGRRLEAVKALGWERVPVTIADNLSEIADLLQAESDENAEREPLTLSEAAALARRIEDELKPLAAERVGGRPSTETPANFAAVSEPRPREVAAKAAGISHETIRKVRQVEEVIEKETTPEPVREVAVAALAEMNATGKADAGHKAVKAAVTAAELVEQFPDLAYYFEQGDHKKVVSLGMALRAFSDPELSMRLNNLRLTVEAEKRGAGSPAVDVNDDVAHADAIFVAFNEALKTFEKNGGFEAIRHALPVANPLSVEMWRGTFGRAANVASKLHEETKPRLRIVN